MGDVQQEQNCKAERLGPTGGLSVCRSVLSCKDFEAETDSQWYESVVNKLLLYLNHVFIEMGKNVL